MRTIYHFNDYLKEKFGTKVYKVSIDARLGCPNRDGTLSKDGCIFCDRKSILPSYTQDKSSIREQLEQGIKILKESRGAKKFIVYFQSDSNTNADPEILKKLYQEGLDHEDVIGISVSTRPDLVDEDILGVIRDVSKNKLAILELGLQSIYSDSLKFLERNHTYNDFVVAVKLAHKYNINVLAHIILGLPSDDEAKVKNMAWELSSQNIFGVKIHHLHVIKNTKLADLYASSDLKLFKFTEYSNLVIGFLENLKKDITVHRLISTCPKDILVAPLWDITPAKFKEDVEKTLLEKDSCQGKFYLKSGS